MSIVKEANDAFRAGRWSFAKERYSEAAKIYGKSLFRLNIKLCEEKIAKNKRGKDSNHILNQFFDHVYVVNLPAKQKDRLVVAKHLREQGLEFELFEATNGYSMDIVAQFEDYQKRPLGALSRYSNSAAREIQRGMKFLESPGAIGYIYTYVRIIRDARMSGFDNILILEDDVLFDRDFDKKCEQFLSKLPEDWKIIQFGASQYGWDGLVEEEILDRGFYHPRRIENCETCGSFAIGLRSSIFDELEEAELSFEAPFDHLPMGEMYERYLGKCFVSYPAIIMPDVEESTIRAGRSQVEHSRRVRWRLENFDYPLDRPSIGVLVEDYNTVKYLNLFERNSKLPFNLKLYHLSSDGLRPLHNPSSELEYFEIQGREFLIPYVDFLVKVEKGRAITEDDILRFIEYKYSLRGQYSGAVFEVEPVHPEHRSGRVSVVIPTYKRPTNLKHAIESVLSQDYPDIEVIVVDDNGVGSEFRSETENLISGIEVPNNAKLKFIQHNTNRNGAAARNTGIFNSTGEYICFLDDDDIYLPGRIAQSVEVLESCDKRVGGVYCGFLGWNSPENNPNRYKSGDLTQDILALNYKVHYLHTNTATYKRSAVFSINGFDESYRRHQDLEFNLRYFELYSIEVVRAALVRLNPQPSLISNKIFNVDMLRLKSKFLSEFYSIIEKMGADFSSEVHKKHWNEVVKYLDDPDEVRAYLSGLYNDGNVQIALSLEDIEVS